MNKNGRIMCSYFLNKSKLTHNNYFIITDKTNTALNSKSLHVIKSKFTTIDLIN